MENKNWQKEFKQIKQVEVLEVIDDMGQTWLFHSGDWYVRVDLK